MSFLKQMKNNNSTMLRYLKYSHKNLPTIQNIVSECFRMKLQSLPHIYYLSSAAFSSSVCVFWWIFRVLSHAKLFPQVGQVCPEQ